MTNRVKSIRPGEGVKLPCRVVAVANITLEGLQTIDGIALAAGDRVLVTAQTATAENGVYVAAAGAWRRAADTLRGSRGWGVVVVEGALYAETFWMLDAAAGSDPDFSEGVMVPVAPEYDFVAKISDPFDTGYLLGFNAAALDQHGERLALCSGGAAKVAVYQRAGDSFTLEYSTTRGDTISTIYGREIAISDAGDIIAVGHSVWADVPEQPFVFFGGVSTLSRAPSWFVADVYNYADSANYATWGPYSAYTGWAVDLNAAGTAVLIGAPTAPLQQDDPSTYPSYGAALGLELSAASFNGPITAYGDEDGVLQSGLQERFGQRVAFAASADIGLVTAASAGSNNTLTVYVLYGYVEGWSMSAPLQAYPAGSFFGHALALRADGTRFAVSAPWAVSGDNNGKVCVYSWDGFTGTASLVQTISMPDQGSKTWSGFGTALAMSRDGNILVVGAGDEANPTAYAGAVYVYRWNGSAYSLDQRITPTDSAVSDWFGWGLSLSADSRYLAVTARGAGTTGAVYVYRLG